MRVKNVQLFRLSGILCIARRALLFLEVGPLQTHAILAAWPNRHFRLESGLPNVVKRLLVLDVILGVRDARLLESKDSIPAQGIQLLSLGLSKLSISLTPTVLVGTAVGASSVHVAVDVSLVSFVGYRWKRF